MFFAVDSKAIDVDAKIPEEVLKQLGELGLFGQQIPHDYGKSLILLFLKTNFYCLVLIKILYLFNGLISVCKNVI